jgi:uncharacterized Zn finger protein
MRSGPDEQGEGRVDGDRPAPRTWVEQWLGLLQERDSDLRRFNQGRAFQRSGRVSGVRIDPGRLVGRVQGSRATPYLVEVLLPPLTDRAWGRFAAVVGSQVRHAARLLAGQAPEGLEEELAAEGIVLFGPREALDARCACGEADRPCAHVVALWHDLAQRLADDPFALLRLRGRGRERLLAELAAGRRRGSGSSDEGVDPTTLPVASWTRASREVAGIELGPVGAPPESPAGPLRLLGDPPGWAGNVAAWDLFRPAVERAAERARQL